MAFRTRCCASARAAAPPSSAHLALLAPRLALLRFVASAFPGRSAALLASSQVERLWEALRSEAERHLLLNWLAGAGTAQSELSLSAALSAEARQYVFRTLLVADAESSALSAAGWTCFRTFFLSINADLGELELERGDDGAAGAPSALAGSDAAAAGGAAIARGSVRGLERLAGLERLKAIALSAEDSDAALGASTLFLQLLSAIVPLSRAVLEATLDWIFAPLSDTCAAFSAHGAAATSPEHKRKAARAVDLLAGLVAMRDGLPPMRGVPHGLRGSPDVSVRLEVQRVMTRTVSGAVEVVKTKRALLALRTHRAIPVATLLARLPWAIAPSPAIVPGARVAELAEKEKASSAAMGRGGAGAPTAGVVLSASSAGSRSLCSALPAIVDGGGA